LRVARTFKVLLTNVAERDLKSIVDYVAHSDGVPSALRVLDRLAESTRSLVQDPERGGHPRELLALGSKDYRQIFFKPYRIIYRIADRNVIVYLIADGRRDMRTLLARRLLGA
jgi:toxin ParE1/3/4